MDPGVKRKGKLVTPVPNLDSLSKDTEALHKTPLRSGFHGQINASIWRLQRKKDGPPVTLLMAPCYCFFFVPQK